LPTPDPEIGYFEQRSAFRTALDNGELIAPTADAEQMQQVITNSTVNGVLRPLIALLTLVVVLSAIPIWLKAVRSGGLPDHRGAARALEPGRPPPTSSRPRRRRRPYGGTSRAARADRRGSGR
jgi:hypothetical protein